MTSCPRVQITTVQDLKQQLASGVLANIDLAMQGTVMLQNNWQLISSKQPAKRCDSAGNETVSEWALAATQLWLDRTAEPACSRQSYTIVRTQEHNKRQPNT